MSQESFYEIRSKLKVARAHSADYIADTRNMVAFALPSRATIELGGDVSTKFTVEEAAHRQIAAAFSIPSRYYRMLLTTHPALWTSTIQYFFSAEHRRFLVRTADGSVRALLGERYKRIDNSVVLDVVEGLLERHGSGIYVAAAELTATHLRVKVIDPTVLRWPQGDFARGVLISNSEVGLGSFSISIFLRNLDVSSDFIYAGAGRAVHAKDVLTYGEGLATVKDETLLCQSMNDRVQSALFEPWLYKNSFQRSIEDSAQRGLNTSVEVLVDRMVAKRMLPLGHKGALLRQLDQPHTAYDIALAISQVASCCSAYEWQLKLEACAGDLLVLSTSGWGALNARE
jgi:hypothetical protein